MSTIDNLQIQIAQDTKSATDGISSLIRTLNRLKKATSNGLGLDEATADLEKLAKATSKINSKPIDDLRKSLSKLGKNKGTDDASSSFTDFFNKMRTGITVAKKVGQTMMGFIDSSSDYTETMNLFNVAMGEYAGEAKKYADEVSNIMGIDPKDWMESQGIFMTLATGFGVAGDRAAVMSQQLTQLGYDISSFYNLDINEAMEKLQSGLAGELEPLRRIGYDLSQAKLEATALSLGIDKAVSSMTQAEKAELRYYAIMTQVTTSHGDMARTLDAPANQLRILKAQLEQAGRAIGNIFIPALNAVLPIITAVVMVVKELANVIASLFGYEFPDVDFTEGIVSGSEAATEGLDSATDAAKKLKNATMGFDELNVISPTTDSGTDAATSGSAFNFELPTYDFIGEATNSRITEIVEKMKEWLGVTDEITSWSDLLRTNMGQILLIVGSIGVALAAWKIGQGVSGIITWLSNPANVATLATIAGVAVAIAGGVFLVTEAMDAFENGVDWENLTGMVVGIVAVVTGLGVAFGSTAASIGLLVGGLALITIGIIDVINNGRSLENVLMIIGGILAVGAAVALLVGGWIPLVIAAIVAVIAAIVLYWEEIVGFFKMLWEKIAGFFVNLWADIKNIWNVCATWFNDKVIQPVVGFFKGLWNSVSGFFVDLWDGIKRVWGIVANWFNTNVIKPIVGFFEGLWNGIKKIINSIIGGIETMANGIVKGINKMIGAMNKLQFDIPDWIPGIGGKKFGFNISLVKEVQIPRLADGGVLDAGQMFIANEAGPELVGNIGRKTAVANANQIVSGIASGVAEANSEQNGLLREQNSLLRALLEKETGTYLDGKHLTQSVEKYQRSRGRVLVTGGGI